jgi:hypothetical protein
MLYNTISLKNPVFLQKTLKICIYVKVNLRTNPFFRHRNREEKSFYCGDEKCTFCTDCMIRLTLEKASVESTLQKLNSIISKSG